MFDIDLEVSDKLKEKKILIVDDEEDLVELTIELLGDCGLECQGAHSGNQAIALLDQGDFDIVLSDVQMNDGSGIDLIKEIRKRDPNIPLVVFISAYSSNSRDELVGLGALELLTKPIDYKILITELEKIIQA